MNGKLAREIRKELKYGKERKYGLINKIITTFTGGKKDRKVKSFTLISDKTRRAYQQTKRNLS